MSMAKHGPIDQIGYLVEDLDASIDRWIGAMGVGPWTVFRNVRLEGRYRGRESLVTMNVGLAYQGRTQIELIEVTNDTPSPYRGADGERLVGAHHVAWIVEDLDAVVRAARADGLVPVFEASNPATRVAYLEAPGEAGVLFEFIAGEGMRAMAEAGIAATAAWDGRDPVTVFDLSAPPASDD